MGGSGRSHFGCSKYRGGGEKEKQSQPPAQRSGTLRVMLAESVSVREGQKRRRSQCRDRKQTDRRFKALTWTRARASAAFAGRKP